MSAGGSGGFGGGPFVEGRIALADRAEAPDGPEEDESPFLEEGEAPAAAGGDIDIEPDEHPANRYLGREFLAWIWFRVERDFGRIALPRVGTVDFWVDDRLVMRGRGDDPQTATFRGGAPSSTDEARAALRAGKSPEEARLGLRLGDREYVLSLRGETLDLSGLKVPQVVKKGEVEALVYERMFLFEEATAILADLYGAFIEERLDPAWGRSIRPRILAWMAGRGGDGGGLSGEPPPRE